MRYETVIGLEVHVELNTKTKLFCGCKNKFSREPNSLVCPVCLGLPGSLPVLNKSAIEKHLLAGFAFNCDMPSYSKFDRKNYFYPDMPKNYQVSQYDLPLAGKGWLDIEDMDGNIKKIGITRIHLEEDTGKSIHSGGSIDSSNYTLLDYNRAGVPLLEIVSEPDMRNADEAYNYLVGLKKILTWLKVSDCKMEEGSLRCDANISLRPIGQKELGVKTEIKNMNSFKSVRSALIFEQKRQAEILDKGGKIIQETRGWDADKNITISMRTKESAHDYRYFPEPDLTPLKINDEWKSEVLKSLPEMPNEMALRFVREYNIPEYDAKILTSYREFADFFENSAKKCDDSKQVSNWMMGDISKYLNSKYIEIQDSKLTFESLAVMINLIKDEEISGKIAKSLIEILLEKGGDPIDIIEKKNWKQITSEDILKPLIQKAISDNPQTLESYLQGKESAKEFFVGSVMRETKGKASPKVLNEILNIELS